MWIVRVGSRHTGVYHYVGHEDGQRVWSKDAAHRFSSLAEACAEADLWTNGHVILAEGGNMTKADYERAAQIIQAYTRIDSLREHVMQCFVDFFKADNPAFDATRFRHACVPGNNVKARKPKAANRGNNGGQDNQDA